MENSAVESGLVGVENGWQTIHAELVRVAKARSGMDADEARWILAAERAGVYRELGCIHTVEYLERVLGYRAKDVIERLRVANCLAQLPMMFRALESGELKWSAVRELTRVVVRETEAVWIAAAVGRTVREVEWMVSGRKSGDSPTDEQRPELMPQR